MMYFLYRSVLMGSGPLIASYLRRREKQGKEDPDRRGERFGIASHARPTGPLLWCHAASVGESVSLLTLIDRLLGLYPNMTVLVTTGTVTSAELMKQRLPARAIHQYIPVDHPLWVNRFLDHWRPNIAIWAESEFWPNLLVETKKRNIPCVLVNARMSDTSYRKWKYTGEFIKKLLSCFEMCLAQTETLATYLENLGAKNVTVTGNIKYGAAPLFIDEKNYSAFQKAVSQRPLWLAASTHPGEEEKIIQVHKILSQHMENILTVIVPRHPKRGQDIQHMCLNFGLKSNLRSNGDLPTQETEIYIADTLGELGLFYKSAPVGFIGGTLVPIGGHNIIEAAQLNSAIIYGPHMQAQRTLDHDFQTHHAAWQITNEETLAQAVKTLLSQTDERQKLISNAKSLIQLREDVLDKICNHLGPVLKTSGFHIANDGHGRKVS